MRAALTLGFRPVCLGLLFRAAIGKLNLFLIRYRVHCVDQLKIFQEIKSVNFVLICFHAKLMVQRKFMLLLKTCSISVLKNA